MDANFRKPQERFWLLRMPGAAAHLLRGRDLGKLKLWD